MTIQTGPGYVSFIDHAFTGALASVIPEAATGYYNFVTGGSGRITGAAATLVPTIVKNTGAPDTIPDAQVATLDLDDGEAWRMAAFPVLSSLQANKLADTKAGGSVSLGGGAGSCVLNGTIYYQTYRLAAA